MSVIELPNQARALRSVRSRVTAALLVVPLVVSLGVTATSQAATPRLSETPHSTFVVLHPGMSGPAVRAMQWRLSLLGYWLGTPNGYFGDSTEQAVYAFKKAAGLTRDAIVGRAMQKALVGGVRPHHRSTTGLVIEVNLQRDLVIIVRNGKDQFILNTSTGGGYSYTSQGVTSVATTPTGHFRILREVNGLDVSPLGQLWRPKYFSGGFAIHGDSYVPAVPVSHGCVRVSDEAIDFIWNRNLAPIGTPVWIY